MAFTLNFTSTVNSLYDIYINSQYIYLLCTDHREGEQLEDRRNVGEGSCNWGDEADHGVQCLMFYDDDDYTRK